MLPVSRLSCWQTLLLQSLGDFKTLRQERRTPLAAIALLGGLMLSSGQPNSPPFKCSRLASRPKTQAAQALLFGQPPHLFLARGLRHGSLRDHTTPCSRVKEPKTSTAQHLHPVQTDLARTVPCLRTFRGSSFLTFGCCPLHHLQQRTEHKGCQREVDHAGLATSVIQPELTWADGCAARSSLRHDCTWPP